MEKLIKVLPIGLFCAFSLKLMVIGVQLPDSIVLLVLAAHSVFHQYKSVDGYVEKVEQKLREQELLISEKAREIEDVKALLSSVKLGQQIRNSQIGRN